MNEQEATELATQLLKAHGERGFEISMPDEAGQDLMIKTFAAFGRATRSESRYFVVRIDPVEGRDANSNELSSKAS